MTGRKQNNLILPACAKREPEAMAKCQGFRDIVQLLKTNQLWTHHPGLLQSTHTLATTVRASAEGTDAKQKAFPHGGSPRCFSGARIETVPAVGEPT